MAETIDTLLGERNVQNAGHFVLNSGQHSGDYFRKDLIIADAGLTI